MYLRTLIIEAIVVAVVLLLIGTVIKMILDKMNIFKSQYNNQLTLLISGALTHLLFELIGGNKYYCKHGGACLK